MARQVLCSAPLLHGFFGIQQDALVRITPGSVKKGGKVPTNGSFFFTIFQTFMTDDGKRYTFGQYPCICEKPEKLEICLSDGRARRIKCLKSDMFWGADGNPVAAEEFLNTMFGQMPYFFTSVEDLQMKWSNPKTHEELLASMDAAGYGKNVLKQIRIQLYVKEGIDELGPDKLPAIISMKYDSIPDGMKVLGGVDVARGLFLDFQKNLYLGDARIAS